MRIKGVKVASRLLFGLLWAFAISSAAQALPLVEIHYACGDAQKLVVRKSGDSAWVQFIDKSYLLRKAHSSIGEKFLAPRAALIIDGGTAVFITEDHLELGQCLEVSRTASAR